MRLDPQALAKLARLAQLRSDIEMRRFSAFRGYVEASRARIGAIEAGLQALYHGDEAFSVAGARLTNALTGEQMRLLQREEEELSRMLPRFEIARQAALREFGRAQVVRRIGTDLQQALDEKNRRKTEDGAGR